MLKALDMLENYMKFKGLLLDALTDPYFKEKNATQYYTVVLDYVEKYVQ
jgi:hypothetical protein